MLACSVVASPPKGEWRAGDPAGSLAAIMGGTSVRRGLIAPAVGLALLAAACAAPSSYNGIALARGAASPELQDLALVF
ncbi:hypothetical protein BSL82_01525 [Tardibacter chloracetimidivorans]|uniref:Uncharacterized protein n=1 Tax=Tardibacter chloracetimidivorans TaxID=1921510 RepID=A0A1L3ZR86_9SPHN|nr:hypothetical protein BSL82_01525 [Tardibacter chloracetimidivorans]